MASANPEHPTDRVGDLVPRRWLAQGGMAELYLATPADPARWSEVVVLKRVLPQFSSSSNFVQMFAREARLASMLRHPNIVEVHDATGPDVGDCFFTMEYVHGVDLGDLIEALKARGGAMPLAHALTIAVAICAGLHHAHEATDASGRPLGIVHRDVSPSNVMLGFDGAIKVTDFGVAKAMALTRLTEEGTRKGKLCYMSPEQATGETLDRRADVFAIATVLYELTTMRRLFGGDNDLAVMYNLMTRPRPRPRDTSPSYPAALEAIVMRGVAADVEARFPTALALQQALEGFAADAGLILSMEAVGAFVRRTMPVPVHPRDDPEFMGQTIALRGLPQRLVTSVGNDDSMVTEAESRAPAPTGPNPSIPIAVGSIGMGLGPAVPLAIGPNPAVPLVTGPHGVVPGAPHAGMSLSSGSVPGASGHGMVPTGAWTRAPPAPPSALHRWSLALALVALLAAVGTGVIVWQANRTIEAAPAADPAPVPVPVRTVPEPTPPTSPEAPPPPTEIVPMPEVQPPSTPPAVAAGTNAEPDDRKKGKRRTKKKRSPKSDAEPTTSSSSSSSKKPSPTDTLLPIRE